MSRLILIDGNNLLHAMHEHAPIPPVGRETLVRVIERWAGERDEHITLVFDGAPPGGDLRKQTSSARVAVRFSAPQTADDVIVAAVNAAKRPDQILVVSTDSAIRHAARLRRCREVSSQEFVSELFRTEARNAGYTYNPPEKPSDVSPDERREWMKLFGADEAEPFDGHDAMKY